MSNTATRKCKACQKTIDINKDDIKDIIYYNKLYYHKDCFIALCEKKMNSNNKRNKPEEWKAALENINNLETETKQILHDRIFKKNKKDGLNEYLLEKYNVSTVPSRVWLVTAELENGVYKRLKSKSIPIDMVLDCWKWAQGNLDKIALRNKKNKVGPQDNKQRILYDLAIVINHIEDYEKHLKNNKIIEIERQQREKESIKIDYNKIKPTSNNKKANDGLDDISDLLDDLF